MAAYTTPDGLACSQLTNESIDEITLHHMRAKLVDGGRPAQCNRQLAELRDRYGLKSLGERLRFLTAIDELASSGLTIDKWAAQKMTLQPRT